MTNLSVTGVVHSLHYFEKAFWLSYKALEAIYPKDLWDTVKMKLLKSKRIDPSILEAVDQEAYNLKRLEIEADWLLKSEDAKATGSAVHDMIHNALVTDLFQARKDFQLEGDVRPTDKPLKEDGLYPEFRMEYLLDPDFLLVGIADVISILDGVISIVDWKTDEDGIKFKGHYDMAKKHEKRLKYPLSKLADVNGVHYLLLLSLYMYMALLLYPHLKPGKLKICLVLDMKLKKVYEVEYLEKEIKTLLAWYLKSTKLKIETDKCREIVY